MAIIQTNALVKGLSGSLGKLVFRQYGSKTILAGKGRSSRKQSAWQQENRNRFKCASAYAKAAMLNADKKAYYWHKAKKLKLPNAYTAAVSDYMRKGEIKETDISQYKGKAGNTIRIKTFKKDFAVHQVQVIIRYADGQIVESGLAYKKDQGVFLYKTTNTIQDKLPVEIAIRLGGNTGHNVTKEHSITL